MSELLSLGVSHKTAPLEMRERMALTEGRAVGMLAELVERQGGHQLTPLDASTGCGAIREDGPVVPSAFSARRKRLIRAREDFAASSNRTSVSHSSAMPAKQIRNVTSIFGGRPPSLVANTRG